MHTRRHIDPADTAHPTQPATSRPPPGRASVRPPADDAGQVLPPAQRRSSSPVILESSGPGHVEYASWLQLIRQACA